MGYIHFSFPTLGSRLVFWHQEVASGPFCLLVNSPWLLVFALLVFFLSLSFFNLCCWKGIYFSNFSNVLSPGGLLLHPGDPSNLSYDRIPGNPCSGIFLFFQNLDLIFLCLFFGLIISFHFWFRDLLRELNKKYEILLMVLFLVFFLFLGSEALLFVSFFWASFHSLSSPSFSIWPGECFYVPDPCELTFANTLLLSNAAVSLGGAFVSLEISSSFLIFFSLFSFILAWTFISLQIKEFRIMGLLINDSVYSCVFFFSYRITFLPSCRWSFSSKSFFLGL